MPRVVSMTGLQMSQITEAFQRCRRERRKAFIPFVAAGDPDWKATAAVLRILDNAGADIIELGIPFSDPIADGPIIQASYQRALARGTSLQNSLAQLRRIRLRAPILLFTYLNPVLQYSLHAGRQGRTSFASRRLGTPTAATETEGRRTVPPQAPADVESSACGRQLASGLEHFARKAAAGGVGGVLLSDLTPEEADPYRQPLQTHGVDTVFLAAPTTTETRLRKILSICSGFLYLISRTGVTGKRTVLGNSLETQIAVIRRASDLPIAIGFGIRTPDDVRRGCAMADGVVVGSSIVKALHDLRRRRNWEKQFERYVSRLAAATRE